MELTRTGRTDFNFSTTRLTLVRLKKRCQELAGYTNRFARWTFEEDKLLIQLYSQYGITSAQMAHVSKASDIVQFA